MSSTYPTTPIDKLWENFRINSIPKNATTMQHRDLKIAFYAGVASVLSLINSMEELELDKNTTRSMLIDMSFSCEMFQKEILISSGSELIN